MDADVVYIEEVEYGITRLAAVFSSKIPERIGPVRSARITDIDLLEQIISQEIEDSIEPIDFDEVKNERSAEDNRIRWALLLKGVGSISPGTRYSPTDMASKLKKLIETKSERYALAQA